MKHILTFESFLSESFLDKMLSVGQNITIENDDEDGDFSAGDYTVIALKKGAVVLKGMGNNRLEVTQGALNDAGYTVNESFLGESEEQNGITQLHPTTLTYWDTGNPNERMPMYDVLVALKDHFKMSKKEFPTDKQEYAPYARASGNKGEVKLPNGCRMYWKKSTPPQKYMTIEGDSKAISETKKLLEEIIKSAKR